MTGPAYALHSEPAEARGCCQTIARRRLGLGLLQDARERRPHESLGGEILSSDRLKTILKDGEFVVYRSDNPTDPTSPRSVLVVMPRSEHPRPQAVRMLENEHSLRDELDPAWALRSLALTTFEGRDALVLEDPGGELLLQRAGTPMDIADVLRVGAGVAAALRQLHGRGLIHMDIKPVNVMNGLGERAGCGLRGFGLASDCRESARPPAPPEFIAGTLRLRGPGTNRENESLDRFTERPLRSWRHALRDADRNTSVHGIRSDETVHCHIAKQPTPPGVKLKGIPDPVSAIIMKLLAKPPKTVIRRRPALESDIRRCLAEWETQRRIGEFPLGEHDTPDRLLIPEKLYGRASEIETLLAAFDRIVVGGRPELVLVSGYSGIGKSLRCQ